MTQPWLSDDTFNFHTRLDLYSKEQCAMRKALESSSIEFVYELIARYSFSSMPSSVAALLYEAVRMDRREVVDLLLEKAERFVDVSAKLVKDAIDAGEFTRACMIGDVDDVRRKLDRGGPHPIARQDPLIDAIVGGHKDVVRILLTAGRGWKVELAFRQLNLACDEPDTIDKLLAYAHASKRDAMILAAFCQGVDMIVGEGLYGRSANPLLDSNTRKMASMASATALSHRMGYLSLIQDESKDRLIFRSRDRIEKVAKVVLVFALVPDIFEDERIVPCGDRERFVSFLRRMHSPSAPSVSDPRAFTVTSVLYAYACPCAVARWIGGPAVLREILLHGNRRKIAPEDLAPRFFDLAKVEWDRTHAVPMEIEEPLRCIAASWIVRNVDELIRSTGALFVRTWLRASSMTVEMVDAVAAIDRETTRLLVRRSDAVEEEEEDRAPTWATLPRDVIETILVRAGWLRSRDDGIQL